MWTARFIAFFLFAASAFAQKPPAMPLPPDVAKNLETLKELVVTLQAAEKELTAFRAELAKAATDEAKVEIAERVDAQRERVRQLRANFRIISSGVEDSTYLSGTEEAASFDSEVKDLLKPLFAKAREVTETPRQMEGLRSELVIWQERENLARAAFERVETTLEAAKDEAIRKELEATRKLWSNRLGEARSQTGTLTRQIEERERNTPGAWELVSRGIADFWRSRGLNLLLALAISLAVFFGSRKLYHLFRRISPLHRRTGGGLVARSSDLIAAAGSVFLGFFAAVMVFYLRGDWLILTVAVVFAVGLLWASKQALPPYIDQLKVILNLGAVRQGERLLFEGIPWRVDRLHFYCEFSNPDLSGAILRLPVRDVLPLHSRPIVTKEPWFPTRENDWVILGDETYGKIIQQTPELVVLLRLGGSMKTYQTAAFLGLSPENLSRGFRISLSFGIDYQHQDRSTTEIPRILQQAIEKQLYEAVDRESLRSVKVEFAQAGASSLDYAILADFSGEVASRLNVLERLIQKTCVDACNEHGWVIPFTQITVHQA